MRKIREVAIIGLGAMGAGYAWQIAECNKDVVLYGIVKDSRRYREKPVLVNGRKLSLQYCSFEEQMNHPMDLIIVAVKSYNLPDVIKHMASMVGPDTKILSLLNGLTSEEKLIQAFGDGHVLYATVTGADANKNGNQVTFNKAG